MKLTPRIRNLDRYQPGALIGFAGWSRSGKDTAAAALLPLGYERVAFADKLRELVYATNAVVRGMVNRIGWEGAKEVNGDFIVNQLVDVGEACRQVFGADFWVEQAVERMDFLGRYVIPDVRYPNELHIIEDLGGRVYRIIRPGIEPASKMDRLLDDYNLPVIRNTGTVADLAGKVNAIAG